MDRYIIEGALFRIPIGLMSRLKIIVYRLIGINLGKKNRFESGRIRRATQIQIGDLNAFSDGYRLWTEESFVKTIRIKIGNLNYFNRNIMIDACGSIEIGNNNLFGPDVYITDSNHTFGKTVSPKNSPMNVGTVKIGDECWIGAKAVILKDVHLGNRCVVAAGAVVTKSFPAGSVIGGVPAKKLYENV